MSENFDKFFREYDLESIKNYFIENEFTSVLALTEVSDNDLKEMGIKAMGKRKQFLAAIKEVQGKDGKVQLRNQDAEPLEARLKLDKSPSEILLEDELPSCVNKKEEPASKRKLDLSNASSGQEEITPQKKPKKSNNSSLKNWLTSPLNVEKVLQAKKIHIYTETEIQKTYGLRRKKMEFMNTKLKQLLEDPTVRSQNKTTILGMAEVAWDRYNAEEAKIDVIEVKSLLDSLEKKGHSYNEKQTSTIEKDSERVNRALSDIKLQLKRIQETKDQDISPSEKKRLLEEQEDQLSDMHKELQKATDALRKACGIKIIQLKALLQKGNEDGNDLDEIGDLSDDLDIIDEVKAEKDDKCEVTEISDC